MEYKLLNNFIFLMEKFQILVNHRMVLNWQLHVEIKKL